MALNEKDKQEIRDLISEAFKDLVTNERYTFQKHLQIFDGRDIQTGRKTGTMIATKGYGDESVTDPGQLLGFFGTPPVNQPDTVADATNQGLTGGDTIDRTKTTADIASSKNAINAVIARLKELGLIQ